MSMMSMMIEVLHNYPELGVIRVQQRLQAGRHPSRLIRLEPLPRWQCGYKSWWQDYEHIRSLRDSNKSFRYWILVAKHKKPRYLGPQCRRKPPTHVISSRYCGGNPWSSHWNRRCCVLRLAGSYIARRFGGGMCLLLRWRRLSSCGVNCSNGVCLPAFRKKKNHPSPS